MKFTEEEIKKLLEEMKNGKKKKEICDDLKISQQKLNYHLKKFDKKDENNLVDECNKESNQVEEYWEEEQEDEEEEIKEEIKEEEQEEIKLESIKELKEINNSLIDLINQENEPIKIVDVKKNVKIPKLRKIKNKKSLSIKSEESFKIERPKEYHKKFPVTTEDYIERKNEIIIIRQYFNNFKEKLSNIFGNSEKEQNKLIKSLQHYTLQDLKNLHELIIFELTLKRNHNTFETSQKHY